MADKGCVDDDTEELIRLTRVTLRGHIRQTKSVLVFLAKLEEQLEAHSQKEAQRDAKTEEFEALRVG